MCGVTSGHEPPIHFGSREVKGKRHTFNQTFHIEIGTACTDYADVE